MQGSVQDELVHIQPKFKDQLLSAVGQFHSDVNDFEETYLAVSKLSREKSCYMLVAF